MDEQSKNEFVSDAKGLARFFSLDVEIKLFGYTVWKYHFPPENS